MDTLCRNCRRVTAAARYVCQACERQLKALLQELGMQSVYLQECIYPTTGPAQRGGSGRAHSPLPVDVRVLDLLGPGQIVFIEDPYGDQTHNIPITPLLHGWARVIACDFPALRTHPKETHIVHGIGAIASWCRWLTAHLPYAVMRPWITEMYTQIEDLLARVRRITHLTPRLTAKDAPCPECSRCALVEREDELGIWCEHCGHELTQAGYDAHRAQVMPGLVLTALRIQVGREQARQQAAAQPATAA